jgi:pantothenate synthetase
LLSEQERAPLTHLLCELSAGTQTEQQGAVALAMDLTSITRSVAQMSTESQLSVRECSATLAEARRQVLDMIECIKIDNLMNPISELLTLIRD